MKEGFSFFLMNTFHSPLLGYGRGGGGGGDPQHHSDFLKSDSDFFSYPFRFVPESGRSADICVP